MTVHADNAWDLSDAESRLRARKHIAAVIPVVPFKGVDSFFDVGGLLAHPAHLQLCFQLLERKMAVLADEIDSIGCFDARGFLFAPYLGVKFQKKVFMLRKPDKMPSVSDSIEYNKEYKGDNAVGADHLSIQGHAVRTGDRVLLLDDLLATGGTAEAGLRLVQQAGGVVKACLFVLEVHELEGRERLIDAAGDGTAPSIMSVLSEKDFS